MSEELKLTGIVEDVEVKQSKAGNTYYKLKINGRTFNTFENPAKFAEKTVEITYKETPNPQNENAPFKNIVDNGIEEVERAPAKAEQQTQSQPQATNSDIQRNRSMSLSYAKDIAISVVKAKPDEEVKMSTVINTAKLFYKYITTGE